MPFRLKETKRNLDKSLKSSISNQSSSKMLLELFMTIFVLVSLPKSRALVPNCNYYDTVDILHIKIQNNLYKYDDLVIPANLTAEYDFIEILDGSKESAKRHLRACVRKLRPCVTIS